MNGAFDGPEFDAPRRLYFPSIMTATSVLNQHDFADWSGVLFSIAWFSARFVECFRGRGIPCFVSRVSPADVSILHCTYGASLSPNELALLRSVGEQISAKHKLGLSWVGSGAWALVEPSKGPWLPSSSEPLRYAPRGLLRALSTGVFRSPPDYDPAVFVGSYVICPWPPAKPRWSPG